MKHKDFKDCLNEADKRMKTKKGHRFVTILKTRCINCGASPKVSYKCKHWFQSFVAHLEETMAERGYIDAKEG